MSQFEAADNTVAKTAMSAYVPSLQRTEGQPPPIAAHGGLSYMSFDQNGDAGTAVAIQDALTEIAEGEGQRVVDMIDKAPPGPIKTKWGLAFRDFDECVAYIRASNSLKAPEGGVTLPLQYTVCERPTYSVVPSNAIWRDPARADIVATLRKNEQDNRRRDLFFPQVLRDARRIGEYHPGLSPSSPECMDRLGLALAHLESKCTNFYDSAEVERVFYPEIEKLLLEFFPDATDALVYNHDVFDKDYAGDRTEDQDDEEPRCERPLRQPRAQRPERQQRPRALPRTAHQEPAELRAHAELHGGGGRRENVAAVHVAQPRQADGDGRAVPLRAVRLALLRGPTVHHQLPDL